DPHPSEGGVGAREPGGSAGDPGVDSADWVAIGRVLGAWRTAGWIRIEPLTDQPRRFRKLQRVRFAPRRGGEARWFAVRRVRVAGARVYLALEGVESREEAQGLAGGLVQVGAGE